MAVVNIGQVTKLITTFNKQIKLGITDKASVTQHTAIIQHYRNDPPHTVIIDDR